jgi:hypothetical protein
LRTKKKALDPDQIPTRVERKSNEFGKICPACHLMRSWDNYYLQSSTYCKGCDKSKKKKAYDKLWVSCSFMASRAKGRSMKTGYAHSEMTTEFLVNLFLQQNGRCAYSNKRLKWGSHKVKYYILQLWRMSLERIDETKGYLKNNVCIILGLLNSPS